MANDFKPYVPMDKTLPEANMVTVLMGILFAVVFTASNVYLGLKTGLTIAAAIPAAILGTGLLKALFKKNSILEANLVAATSAVGESIAGGIIFTLPAIILWGNVLHSGAGIDNGTIMGISDIAVITIVAGLSGILFVLPFRRYLIVQEHGKLLFPESIAVSEILVNANKGGSGFATVMKGLAVGGVFKFLSGGLKVWSEGPSWIIAKMGTAFSVSAVPSLLGVGFIVGLKVAKYMFAGAFFSFFALIPLIGFFGAYIPEAVFPSTVPIAQMGAIDIWSKYVRYIGAGAVAMGGFISLITSLPAIYKSFKDAMSGLSGDGAVSKLRQDISTPLSMVGVGAFVVFIAVWMMPLANNVPSLGVLPAILVIFFSFFFGVVSARMCGIMGASNNPVSGMTIASLLVIASAIKMSGVDPELGKVLSILAVGVVCVSIAVSGGAAQSLKHTYLVGGTPRHVEWTMYAGLIVAAFVAGAIIFMLHGAFGLGTAEVPAPQAGLMMILSEGVMTGNIPWLLVGIGMVIGFLIWFIGLPVLPIALGLYLPISLSAAIITGAFTRELVERKFSDDKEEQGLRAEKGVLLASGLVAGDALIGILIATFITLGVDISGLINLPFSENSTIGMAVFLGLGAWVYTEVCKGKSEKESVNVQSVEKVESAEATKEANEGQSKDAEQNKDA